MCILYPAIIHYTMCKQESFFYLIGLWKHVQCLISLRELINSYRLCSASTNMNLLLQRKGHLDLIFIFDARGNKSLALIYFVRALSKDRALFFCPQYPAGHYRLTCRFFFFRVTCNCVAGWPYGVVASFPLTLYATAFAFIFSIAFRIPLQTVKSVNISTTLP